jgi:hypothetical protein
MGRGEIIKKKTSHVTLVLDVKREEVKKARKKIRQPLRKKKKVEEKES